MVETIWPLRQSPNIADRYSTINTATPYTVTQHLHVDIIYIKNMYHYDPYAISIIY